MTTTPHDRRPRQDADGTVYLGYFVPEHSAGFTWSGDPHQPVEVCYGGMGEPVVDTFMMPARLLDLAGYLAEFKRQCDAFLAHAPRHHPEV